MRIRECPITSCTPTRTMAVHTLQAVSKSRCNSKLWPISPGRTRTQTQPCPCAKCKTMRLTLPWARLGRTGLMVTCKGTSMTWGRIIEIRDHALAIKAPSQTTIMRVLCTHCQTMPRPCPLTRWCRTCQGVLAGQGCPQIMVQASRNRSKRSSKSRTNDECEYLPYRKPAAPKIHLKQHWISTQLFFK